MLWLKAFHIIFMVCWFAGIFYLPRLFVYHAMSADQATRDQLKIMERKLYRFTTPFALLTVLLGGALLMQSPAAYLAAGWMQIKLALVAGLLIYHWYCGRLVSKFADDSESRDHVFFRFFNELPVFVLFGAVILAVLKPF